MAGRRRARQPSLLPRASATDLASRGGDASYVRNVCVSVRGRRMTRLARCMAGLEASHTHLQDGPPPYKRGSEAKKKKENLRKSSQVLRLSSVGGVRVCVYVCVLGGTAAIVVSCGGCGVGRVWEPTSPATRGTPSYTPGRTTDIAIILEGIPRLSKVILIASPIKDEIPENPNNYHSLWFFFPHVGKT